MHEIIDAWWRIYPASAVIAGGACLFVRGLRREAYAHRLGSRDAAKPLTTVEGIRLMLVGLVTLALGAAWAWQIGWLALLALIIGAEEALETSIVVFGLTRGRYLRLPQRREP